VTELHPPLKSNDTAVTLRGTGVVAGLTLLSRALGFVRDLLVARLFGATSAADSFFVAFRIPNLLRSFVAEGAMSSAFVPVFATEAKEGVSAAQRAFGSALSLLLLVTTTLSVLGVLYAQPIVEFIAPGFLATAADGELCILLTRIMMPYIIFVSVVALMNGALSTYKVFGISAWAQVLMNIALIAGAVAAGYHGAREASVLLALSVLIGGAVQVIAQVPALNRAGLGLWPLYHPLSVTNRAIVRLVAPALLGATVYQLSIFINTILASLLESGSVSWLFYADRVTQFPIGVFTLALGSVLLPMLASAAVEKDSGRAVENLTNALRFTIFLLVPLCAFLYLHAEGIVRLLFERGKFTAFDTLRTAEIVRALTPGLLFTSCYSMVVRLFIARRDTVTPVLIGVGSLLVSVLTALLVIGPLPESASSVTPFWLAGIVTSANGAFPSLAFGATGLAIGSSSGALFSAFVGAVLAYRLLPTLPVQRLLIVASISTVASLLTVLFLNALPRLEHQLLELTKEVLLFGLTYFAIAAIFRSREGSETFALFRRLLHRRQSRRP
jgi:putative peptidoglycan lipid II flippase